MTEEELFYSKLYAVADSERKEHLEWGVNLEENIAVTTAKWYDLKVKPLNHYMRIPEYRIGSSFDYEISDILRGNEERPPFIHQHLRLQILTCLGQYGAGLFEIKNVSEKKMKKDWTSQSVSRYIEWQVQHQMLVGGYKWACVMGLGGGNQHQGVIFEADPFMQDQILKVAKEFWDRIANDDVPVRDTDSPTPPSKSLTAIDSLHPLSLLGCQYLDIQSRIKDLESIKKELGKSIIKQLDGHKGAYNNELVISHSVTKERKATVITVGKEHIGEQLTFGTNSKPSSRLTVTLKDKQQ